MINSNKNNRKVIIIGSGPAGYTSAIYTARASLEPLVLEGSQPGGQLTITTVIENFPGFPEGIDGPELMMKMKNQAERFGATFVSSSAAKIDLSLRPFSVVDANGITYNADSIIIATGASARMLGLPEELGLVGRGVSTCATCDGFFYRDKIVHLVGGGDTALEEAHFLTKFAKKLYIVHRRNELRASKIMQARALSNPKIEFVWDSEVVKILSDHSGVNGIVVRNVKDGRTSERYTDGLFLAIGHVPNTSFLSGQIDLDAHGFIRTNNGTYTNVEGVFACGDVQDSYYRQAITAAGSGCMAAIQVERFLESIQVA